MTTTTTSSLDVGTLVWVTKFEFAGAAGGKRAPGVVLSSHRYHQERPDVILARVTSQMHYAGGFASVLIHNWVACGLPKPSVIKPFLFTVERRQVESVIGRIDAVTLADLKRAFKSVFPLAA